MGQGRMGAGSTSPRIGARFWCDAIRPLGVRLVDETLAEDAIVDQAKGDPMIRRLPSGEYRLYSRKKNPKTGKRRNLGTFASREEAEKHERAVQYFKRL